VTSVDSAIGRLLGRLDELGLADHTLILFSSDNGPEAMEISNARHSGVGSPGPLRGRKRSLYDGGVRMPFLVRWPGHVPAGRIERESIVAAVDFFPSLCALTGAPVPDQYAGDGEDVSDIWLGASRPRKGPLMWEWRYRVFGHVYNRSPILAIRDGRWKLLMNPDRSRVELYDMTRDAREMTNLAQQHEDIVKRLSQRILSWQKTLPESPFDPDAGQDEYHGPPAEMPEVFD
jgi:N-acetylgalactosamine-6-sulfatase